MSPKIEDVLLGNAKRCPGCGRLVKIYVPRSAAVPRYRWHTLQSLADRRGRCPWSSRTVVPGA